MSPSTPSPMLSPYPVCELMSKLGGNIDQDAMAWVFEQDSYKQHVVYQPVEWHNLYPETDGRMKVPEPGDLLVHFAGTKGKE